LRKNIRLRFQYRAAEEINLQREDGSKLSEMNTVEEISREEGLTAATKLLEET